MNKTAIVLLNWNGAELLKKFIPGVIQNSKDAQVVVADNHSSDSSLTWLKENHPSAKIIQLDRNYGFAGGYNHALKQIDASYYVLLNTDVEVENGWLEPLTRFMDENPRVAACQPKIKSYFQRTHFEHAGAAGGFMDRFGYPFCRGRLFQFVEEDQHQYDRAECVFWATGACMVIRSEIFHKMQGFDETFFAHMEEIDLCWRIQRAGFEIYCIPESQVFHVGGGTLPKKNPRKTYYNFRNNLMMIHKNLPVWKHVFVLRLFLDGLAGLKFLLDGDWKDCLAVIKAHFYFYRHYHKRSKIRKEWLAFYPALLPPTVYKGSIVWQYFIKKKKKFSGLKF